MPAALIMAEGHSTRMRTSSDAPHKALVAVLGVPLVERNLLWLLASGLEDVYIAAAADEPALLEYIDGRGRALAASFGARLTLLIERAPLGTLGAARLCATDDDLVVVNVDNLTSIDLNALLESHRRESAAMTIASHTETFCMPFGQLMADGNRILAILEKPQAEYRISSGTYVLAPNARKAIAADRAVGAPDLVEALKRDYRLVVAHPHQAPWIDVNDQATLRRAEDLVARRYGDLECLWETPDEHRVVIARAANANLRVAEAGMPTPRSGGHGTSWPGATLIVAFDEPLLSGRVIRCHLFESDDSLNGVELRALHDDVGLESTRVAERCHAYQRLYSNGRPR